MRSVNAYYNENDPFAAAWLRSLIDGGHIASGFVDERSILLVDADDLDEFTQHHFFAGIGGWSLALRSAGWPDDRPVWTGSCPCQPFSTAGKRKGFNDERHLWPRWRKLIDEQSPPIVFGEQVAAATEWLRLVRSDLEALGYAVGAIPIEAASAGADHLRDRFWFVADRAGQQVGSTGQSRQRRDVVNDQSERRGERRAEHGVRSGRDTLARASGIFMADAERERGEAGISRSYARQERLAEVPDDDSGGCSLADADESQRRLGNEQRAGQQPQHDDDPRTRTSLEWVTGADGKARRVKPGIRLLVNGFPNRVGLLRGFGNAIDPRPASEIIRAYRALERGSLAT